MKFNNILILISFFLISDIISEEKIPITIISPENPTCYDISSTFVKVIGEILQNMHSNLNDWRTNRVSFNHEVIDINQTSQSDNYSVSFNKIYSDSVGTETTTGQVKIHCEFAKHLAIRIPFNGNAIRFYGHIDIINNLTNSSIQASYNVTFYNLHLSITAKPNFNSTKISPSEDMQVEITYNKTKIDIDIVPQFESIATVALGGLLNEIKIILKSLTYNKWTAIVQEKVHFSSLLDTCMHPKDQISRINQTFLSQEQNHYYIIREEKATIESSITINMKSIMIKGLSNFQVIDAEWDWDDRKRSYDDYYVVRGDRKITFRIDNLEVWLEWNYDINPNTFNDSIQYTSWQFKIDQISFHLQNSYYYSNRPSIKVNIAPILPVAQSIINDTFSSLVVTVLKNKLGPIIESALESALRQQYY